MSKDDWLFLMFYNAGVIKVAALHKQGLQGAARVNIIIPANRKDFFTRYLLLSIVYLLFSVAPAFAQISPEHAQKVIGPNSYDTLLSKARFSGEVNIIVKVKVPFQNLSELPKTEEMAGMATISQVQGNVMQELAGHRVTRSHSFKYIPYISMTVDEAALNAVLGLSNVVSVEEDIPVPPTLDLSEPRMPE